MTYVELPPHSLPAAKRISESLTAANELREAYAAQQTIIGTFLIELPVPRTITSLALAGFDFVVLDLEHSTYGIEGIGPLVAECRAVGLPTLVRVETLHAASIGKVLDAGVNGVMVPRIRTAQEATEAVRAARYSPSGDRGLCPLTMYAASPLLQAVIGESVLVVLQIEGREGLRHAAEIASTPGVDGVFVGPYDLSQALGMPGDIHAEEVVRGAESVAELCQGDGMLGIYIHEPSESRLWSERGFRFQCVAFDGRMLLYGARSFVEAVRAGLYA